MPHSKGDEVRVLDQLEATGERDLVVFELETLHGDPGPLEPNRHTFYEIILLSEAHEEIHTIDFEPYVMRPGSIFFLAPGQIHFWEPGTRLRGKVLRFTEACFVTPCVPDTLSILSQETSARFMPDATLFATIMGYLERIQQEQSHDAALHFESANALLTLLLADLERAFVKSFGKMPQMQSELMERLLGFHRRHGWRIATVEEAAAHLGVSEDGLNREVKRCSGLSAGAFLRSRTILEAKRMLIFLPQPASAIGEKLGFVDAAYFSRFFKRETGMSPTQFRRKYP